jgi:hypothetical protein
MRLQAYEAQWLNICNEREYKNLFLHKEEKEEAAAEHNVNYYDYDDNGDNPSRIYSLVKMKLTAILRASLDKFPAGLVCVYFLSSIHR